MSVFHSDFLNVLHARGFIHQASNAEGLDALAKREVVTGYIGFDCTAPSLHVGSLVQIMMLYWMQQTGHRPIVLLGGGTTRVGDPSFRDDSRPLLDEAAITANVHGIRRIFDKFLTFGDGPRDAIMANNDQWLSSLRYVDFLREVGQHFSVNQMIQRDAVRLRLEREQHLSFLEFNYMLLQAYDFVELARRYACRLQLGGSDQWGNIVSGIELGRRLGHSELFAVTSPLITTASGAKMGKTITGAVWLNSDARSPYEYWQFWRDCADGDVVRFLKLFTTLPLDEIGRLARLRDAEINEAKKILASEATALAHGRAAAEAAAETARRTFEGGDLGDALPRVRVPSDELTRGLGVLSAFVTAGLCASNSDARRSIKAQALKVNDVPVADEKRRLDRGDLIDDGVIKLSLGKKRHVLLAVS